MFKQQREGRGGWKIVSKGQREPGEAVLGWREHIIESLVGPIRGWSVILKGMIIH